MMALDEKSEDEQYDYKAGQVYLYIHFSNKAIESALHQTLKITSKHSFNSSIQPSLKKHRHQES